MGGALRRASARVDGRMPRRFESCGAISAGLAFSTMDNRSFWNHRYKTFPQIGSGPGSRGYAAVYKNEMIRGTIEKYGIRSILDIGCGDLCWLDDEIMKVCSYVGCDIAESIIERNASVQPAFSSSNFLVHDIVREPLTLTADLVVCFDVLIHQIELPNFRSALRNTLETVSKIGLISYLLPPSKRSSSPPVIPSNESPRARELDAEFAKLIANAPRDVIPGMIAYHGALPDLITDIRTDLLVGLVGKYRAQGVYEITHCPARSIL